MQRVVIGIGSNMGMREGHLKTACEALSRVLMGIQASPVYESPALLPEDAPQSWDTPFLNMAVAGECDYEPKRLLAEMKNIEQHLGRGYRGYWGPREIDLDILAMGACVHEAPGLCVPHRHLLGRDFALLPLADIWPEWKYPQEGIHKDKTAATLADELFPSSSRSAKRMQAELV